uniref:Uncharacterized protein n=1 Tax=Siphoviridae sp. ctGO42 TaxID=2827566 RepID=A0A8S5LJ45_9CAUD|nr:MAG TPA: hypothetical protein [Siphoviridae sp. ctGO42]
MERRTGMSFSWRGADSVKEKPSPLLLYKSHSGEE